MSAQQAFSLEFPLMWESISFDVATVSTQAMPYYHALNFSWGEHYIDNIIDYVNGTGTTHMSDAFAQNDGSALHVIVEVDGFVKFYMHWY